MALFPHGHRPRRGGGNLYSRARFIAQGVVAQMFSHADQHFGFTRQNAVGDFAGSPRERSTANPSAIGAVAVIDFQPRDHFSEPRPQWLKPSRIEVQILGHDATP